ncbi:MAG: anaerobic ribonucleoside-triphosphate reductase activating protein [Candidatus Thermoplasmatota archaeon]
MGGLQKTSLIDYPDKIAAVVWTVGCNFRCPFCYNPELVKNNKDLIPEEQVFSFLEERKELVEGVSISGGEPFLQTDLKDFVKKIKDMGYLVKVDTNGTYPDKLKELLEEDLLDYVAMDVKAPKDKYDKVSGVKTDITKVDQSIKIIREKAPDYEFRTTMVPDLLSMEDIVKIGEWLKDSKKFFIQQFKNDSNLIDEDFRYKKTYPKEMLEEALNEVKSFFDCCKVRGR